MIGAIIGSALSSGISSALAGRAQEKAAGKASKQAQEQYDQRREDLMPWMESGQGSVNALNDLMGSGYFDKPFDASQLAEDPGYQFRLAQGEQAINRGASARGDFFSGRAGKELSRYGQGLASQEYGNAYAREMARRGGKYSRLSDMSRGGASAAAGIGQAGGQLSNQLMQGTMAAGQAQAGMYGGIEEAISGGIGNVLLDKYLAGGGVTSGGRQGSVSSTR